ncbi:MAG: hypothetical protein CL857_01840 [Cryomorphaceae bacterium]|nr:hypothetical protein [Cryomorphaceae bacterium]
MLKKVISYIQIAFCWIIISPLNLLIARERGLTVVIGKLSGEIADNTKYLFIHGIRKNKNIRFLTQSKSVLNAHSDIKKHIVLFTSLKGVITLLKASQIVVDYSHWSYRNPLYFFLSLKAKKVHLWHGLTFKPVELGLIANGTPYLKSRLFRHVVNYDLMVSTSDFWTKHLYKKYFLAKDVENYGYPRNDVLFRTPDHLDLIGVDVNKFKLLKMAKEKGHKIAIYSPTFRDDGSDAFSSGHLNIEKLNTFLSKHNIILVLKMHPLNARTYEDLSNIVNYDKDFDVYPVMSLSDMMITDYSSIYIDYLIIDRPIVFFNYDYEKYLEQNRKLQTKFLDTIPGVVTTEQEGLEKAILDHLISDNDTHKSDRTKLKEISYEFFDGDSAHRIFCKFEKWQK